MAFKSIVWIAVVVATTPQCAFGQNGRTNKAVVRKVEIGSVGNVVDHERTRSDKAVVRKVAIESHALSQDNESNDAPRCPGSLSVPRPRQARNCVNRLALFHIPKTGGRAITYMLTKYVAYALNKTCTEAGGISPWRKSHTRGLPSTDFLMRDNNFEPYVVEFHTTEARAAAAIPLLKEIKYPDGCGVITATVLRDPVERSLSNFDYDIETKCLPKEARAHADMYFSNISDLQSRFMTTSKYCALCGDFWLKPDKMPCKHVTKEEHNANLKLLKEMDVVGIGSDMESFLREVLRQMGFEARDVNNVTAADIENAPSKAKVLHTHDSIKSIPAALTELIKKHNKYDLELYDEAVKLASDYRIVY